MSRPTFEKKDRIHMRQVKFAPAPNPLQSVTGIKNAQVLSPGSGS